MGMGLSFRSNYSAFTVAFVEFCPRILMGGIRISGRVTRTRFCVFSCASNGLCLAGLGCYHDSITHSCPVRVSLDAECLF